MEDYKKLCKTNVENENKLNKEFELAYTDIIVYLSNNFVGLKREQIRSDILSMFLEAQFRGESIESIIGSDYKRFCNNLIESYGKRNSLDIIKEQIEITCKCIPVLGFILLFLKKESWAILKNLFHLGGGEYAIPLTVGDCVSILLIIVSANIFISSFAKNIFDMENKKIKYMFIVAYWGIMILAMVVNYTFKGVLIYANFFALIFIFLAFGGISALMENAERKKGL